MSTQGWQLAEEGMILSYENSPDAWKEDAKEALRRTAEELDEFTVDDVWERFPDGLEKANGSALGHVIHSAKKHGWIEPTGNAKRSSRPIAHSKYNPIWRSKLRGA